VRGGVVASTDIKTYDLGNLYLCTSGFAGDGTVCGELYVEYTVVLMTPQISSDAISSAKIVATAGLDITHMFGTTNVKTGGLACTITDSATLRFDEAFEGLLFGSFTGSGWGNTDTYTSGGTATGSIIVSNVGVVGAGGGNKGTLGFLVKALRGQTIAPACTADTISAATWWIGNYDFDL